MTVKMTMIIEIDNDNEYDNCDDNDYYNCDDNDYDNRD